MWFRGFLSDDVQRNWNDFLLLYFTAASEGGLVFLLKTATVYCWNLTCDFNLWSVNVLLNFYLKKPFVSEFVMSASVSVDAFIVNFCICFHFSLWLCVFSSWLLQCSCICLDELNRKHVRSLYLCNEHQLSVWSDLASPVTGRRSETCSVFLLRRFQ